MVASILSALYEISRSSGRVVRVEESRQYTVSVESGDVEGSEVGVYELGREYCTQTVPKGIVGVDSSSRVVDTPYMFIAVGSATGISRLGLKAFDIPSPSSILTQGDHKYILVIPEVQPFNYNVLEELGVEYKDPSSRPYPPEYNKALALEEHRVELENLVLENVLSWGELVFLDGPLFLPTHPVTEARGRSRLIDVYKENWSLLMRRRLGIIEKIDSSTRVFGIVKRLQYTHILSRNDPFKLGVEKVSDHAYLSILSERMFVGKKASPFALGPIRVRSEIDGRKVDRSMWYICVPRRFVGGETGSYVFFRVETLGNTSSLGDIQPVLFDSVCAGAGIPLSIVIADQRVKRLSEAIARNVMLAVGVDRESTLQYLSP